MSTSKKVTLRMADLAGSASPSVIAYSNELASAIAQGLQGVMAEASAAKAAFDAARGRQLPFMLLALKDVAPVNGEVWDRMRAAGFRAWAIAQGCTFGPEEDAKPMKGGKVDAYAAVSYATVKVATIAITNGIAPIADESLQGFVKRVRAICATRGLIEDRAPTAAKAKATPDKVETKETGAARILASNDSALADALAFAVMPAHVEAFKGWYARQLALAVAMEAAKA